MNFKRFRGQGNEASLQDYLRIKYEVFGREFAWPIQPQAGTRLAQPDAFDAAAYFVVAQTPDGKAVGCARVIPLRIGFPHQSLLGPALARLGRELADCGTLNSVAVTPEWRARSPAGTPAKSPDTVAAKMVGECHDLLRELGVSTCVLTTTEIVAGRFFTPLGYVALGPAYTAGMYSAPLVNMLLVLA